jgi:hypothetical protein
VGGRPSAQDGALSAREDRGGVVASTLGARCQAADAAVLAQEAPVEQPVSDHGFAPATVAGKRGGTEGEGFEPSVRQ